MSAPKVFISYASEDEAEARNLHKRLLNAGFAPWLDRINLVGGEDWDRAIRRALRKTDFVVFCLSKTSTSKRSYLQRELKIALDLWQEMLRDDIYLVPVRLEPCEVPEDLANLHWINSFEEGGWNRLFLALKRGVERRETERSPAAFAAGGLGTVESERIAIHPATGDIVPASSQASDRAATSPAQMPAPGAVADFGTPPTRTSENAVPISAGTSPELSADIRAGTCALVPYLPEEVTRAARLAGLLEAFARIPAWWFLLAGAGALLVGNLFLAVGHSDSVLTFLFDSFGFDALRRIDLLMRSTTVLIVGLGYLLLVAWWLSRRRRGPGHLLARWAPGFLLVAVGILNIGSGIPSRLALTRVLSEKIVGFPQGWTERLMSWQTPSGGITAERTQVWTTAQVLTGTLAASRYEYANVNPDSLRKAFEYIESRRSTDGWAYWDDHTRTVTEVTGWVVVATAKALQPPEALPGITAILKPRIERDLEEIIERQHPSGGWTPIKEATTAADTRTYSTLIAVWALLEAKRLENLDSPPEVRLDEALRSGARWLLMNRHPTRDWVPNPRRTDAQTESFPGLTAQVIFVLSELGNEEIGAFLRSDSDFLESKRRFLDDFRAGEDPLSELDTRTPDGDQHLSVTDFLLEGSTFLGFPWTFAAMGQLAHDNQLTDSERDLATRHWVQMALRADELNEHVLSSLAYVTAENLYSLVQAVKRAPWRKIPQPRAPQGK